MKLGIFYITFGGLILVAVPVLLLTEGLPPGVGIVRYGIGCLAALWLIRNGITRIQKARIVSALKDITPEGFNLKELPPKEH
jgi:hypothetical protein